MAWFQHILPDPDFHADLLGTLRASTFLCHFDGSPFRAALRPNPKKTNASACGVPASPHDSRNSHHGQTSKAGGRHVSELLFFLCLCCFLILLLDFFVCFFLSFSRLQNHESLRSPLPAFSMPSWSPRDLKRSWASWPLPRAPLTARRDAPLDFLGPIDSKAASWKTKCRNCLVQKLTCEEAN